MCPAYKDSNVVSELFYHSYAFFYKQANPDYFGQYLRDSAGAVYANGAGIWNDVAISFKALRHASEFMMVLDGANGTQPYLEIPLNVIGRGPWLAHGKTAGTMFGDGHVKQLLAQDFFQSPMDIRYVQTSGFQTLLK